MTNTTEQFLEKMRFFSTFALYDMRDQNRLPVQIAGYGAAPLLSASRALVRKGLARAGLKTGHYAITEAGMLTYFQQGHFQ